MQSGKIDHLLLLVKLKQNAVGVKFATCSIDAIFSVHERSRVSATKGLYCGIHQFFQWSILPPNWPIFPQPMTCLPLGEVFNLFYTDLTVLLFSLQETIEKKSRDLLQKNLPEKAEMKKKRIQPKKRKLKMAKTNKKKEKGRKGSQKKQRRQKNQKGNQTRRATKKWVVQFWFLSFWKLREKEYSCKSR